MAGDWVKMRVWLGRDPKTIAMADRLASDDDFLTWLPADASGAQLRNAYEYVTRDVTVALCVTGLLVTWGTARERGRRVDDDLVLDYCDLNSLSRISGIPGFGQAMGAVGWAVELQGMQLAFPNFFGDNVPPDEKHKSKSAERQAKYREKLRNSSATSDVTRCATNGVTRGATVTHREEKRREEKSNTNNPPTPFSDPSADSVLSLWNDTPGAIPIRKLTGKRRQHLEARLKEPDWDWLAAISKFPLPCFSDPVKWQPNFDWFIRPDTVNAILEGKYDFTPKDAPKPPASRVPTAEDLANYNPIDGGLRR